jgi:hypothetical protein
MAKRYELPDAAWELAADIFSEARRDRRPMADGRWQMADGRWQMIA